MKIRKLGLLFAFVLLTGSLMAHPPKKVDIKFDIKTQELDIKIDHLVKDTKDHFIENISVSVNGEIVLSTDYTKQKDLKADVYRLKLKDVKKGDIIKVAASCNKWGKKKQSLTVK